MTIKDIAKGAGVVVVGYAAMLAALKLVLVLNRL